MIKKVMNKSKVFIIAEVSANHGQNFKRAVKHLLVPVMCENEISLKAEEVITYLGLVPHPEGGYFRETYQSDDKIPADGLPSRYGAERHICTAIYYMITRDNFSAIHRVLSDEVYHFYLGGL